MESSDAWFLHCAGRAAYCRHGAQNCTMLSWAMRRTFPLESAAFGHHCTDIRVDAPEHSTSHCPLCGWMAWVCPHYRPANLLAATYQHLKNIDFHYFFVLFNLLFRDEPESPSSSIRAVGMSLIVCCSIVVAIKPIMS